MRKKSVASALASLGRAAKQNHFMLTPKSKQKKDSGSRSRHRRRDESSGSSSALSVSSSGSSSCSDLSQSESDFSSSEEESKRERYSRGRRSKDSRRHRRSREPRRHRHRDRARRRSRRRDRYSPDSYGGYASTPQRRLHNPSQDDAAQMADLLMRIMPFYGKGDGHSDTVVIDTIHRLPAHALEMQDIDGNTLLLLACQAGAYDLMPILLSRGCNVNTTNKVGATSLHFACFVDTFNPNAAMTMIRHGATAEVAEVEFGCTPLHWAAFSGHVELCTALCRAGADPSTLDKNSCTPIHYAKQNGHAACAQLLESFAKKPTSVGSPAAPPLPPPSEKPGWVRCLDASTGSSFYHNKDTGESLWGDEFRKEGEGVSITSGATVGLARDESANGTVESPAPSTLTPATASDLTLANEADLDSCPNVPLKDPIEERALSAIQEEFGESSSNENVLQTKRAEPVSEEAPLDDILEDVVETSSVEDAEPTHSVLSNVAVEKAMGTPRVEAADIKDMDGTADMIQTRLNSWDAEEEVDESSLPTAVADINLHSNVGGGVDSIGSTSSVPELPSNKNPSAQADQSTFNLTRNQSFEERISSLHQRMESQLMHRLQHLEDKITQQTLEASVKADEGSCKLQESVSEMTSTILRLQTESGSKDLQIISLKQQIVQLEAEKISKLPSVNACVGDGDVNNDGVKLESDEILAVKEMQQKELRDANDEIDRLKLQIDELSNSLNAANGRYAQSQRHLELAEQLARDEKASRSSMKDLLEKTQKEKGDVDSASTALIVSLQEENVQLKEKIRSAEATMLEERTNIDRELQALRDELSVEKSKAAESEKELEEAVARHKSSVAELGSRHSEEMTSVNLQLSSSQDQLREAKMAKMELMLAKDEAVDAMETALDKARTAEAKLQQMTDFISKTEELKRSNDQLNKALSDETEKRKVLHNTLEDLKGRIRVYVRVRPLSENEMKASYVNVLTKEDDRTIVMAADAATAQDVRDWEFDKIFSGTAEDGNTQEAVFRDTSLLITSAIDGFNVCIFAYGQTGSGKTYTMIGADGQSHQGLAPRVAHELFRKLAERESSHHIEVSASMLELYTDKLRDLLVAGKSESEGLDLKIRLAEHTSSGLVEVENSIIERVSNAEELLDVFDRGTNARASSSTKMNADSSRSHMIATIVLSLRNKRTGKIVHGKLTLVDLAGSERVAKSGATGHQLKEAQSINKSLSALGDVIGALTSGGRQHIPYRNHPLTMLMSDSIGGNAKTLMFVNCSPADYNRRETANSLDFAKRCRNVTNNAVASKSAKGTSAAAQASTIKALRAELSKIKEKEKTQGGGPKRRPVGMRRPGVGS